jgi:hypothetical protein
MKLLGVEAIDVRGLANGIYSFAKAPEEAHDRVLVTGGPGAGKTRLLQVIVAARQLLTPHEGLGPMDSFVRRGNDTSKAIVSWLLSTEEQATIGAASPVVRTEIIFGMMVPVQGIDDRLLFLLERYAHDDRTPKLEYFSERRRLDLGGGDLSLDERVQAPLRASADPRKFAWVPGFLARLRTAPESATRFAATLERFSRSLSYDLHGHVLSSRGRMLRDLKELSTSEADAVMFAATAALVGLSRSIVLVDRPDVNGIELDRALAGLSALGADNQLIVTTSSTELAAGFDGAVVALGSGQFKRGSR